MPHTKKCKPPPARSISTTHEVATQTQDGPDRQRLLQ